MTIAPAQSHHSRCSIRRKLVRSTLVCSTSGSLTLSARCSSTDHHGRPRFRAGPYYLETQPGPLRGSLVLPEGSCTTPTKRLCGLLIRA